MKRFLLATILTLTLGVAGASAQASYCGTTQYDLKYRAAYEYPTGTYWQKQIAHFPAYYTTNNAFYQSHYGC